MEIKNMDSITFYTTNADRYITETLNADMSALRKKFISYLPAHAAILDAGCGSGRDSKAFKESGFDLYAMDASEPMVEHCRTIIGDRCELASFQEYHTDIKFDGIWACASFLHLKPEELDAVLEKFTRFLKPGGVFFMSFKYGEKDYIKDGRYFNCHTSETIAELLNTLDVVEIIENFITSDVREGRSGEKWVNVIVRKDV
jgi:SAM-dependent methyltransferase